MMRKFSELSAAVCRGNVKQSYSVGELLCGPNCLQINIKDNCMFLNYCSQTCFYVSFSTHVVLVETSRSRDSLETY